jgi:hypothetical protein
MGFHRSLQEGSFAQVTFLQSLLSSMESSYSSGLASRSRLLAEQTSHATVHANALTAINNTLASAASLTNTTRRLSAEAVQIRYVFIDLCRQWEWTLFVRAREVGIARRKSAR